MPRHSDDGHQVLAELRRRAALRPAAAVEAEEIRRALPLPPARFEAAVEQLLGLEMAGLLTGRLYLRRAPEPAAAA